MIERLNRYVEYCPLLAAWCFVLPFLNVVFQNLFWVLGIHALVPGGALTLICSTVILFRFTRDSISQKEFVLVTLSFILYATVALVASLYFYDSTRDGTSYHQEAVLQIKEGWNPIREKLGDEVNYAVFLNHYPKTAWTNDATIFAFTGKIESAKMLNLFYPLGTFLLTFYLLVRLRLQIAWALLIALAASLNSITIVEMFSFMVDHINASIMTSLVAVLTLLVVAPDRKRIWYLVLFALVVIFDTKLTSIVNLGMFLFFYCFAIFLFRRTEMKAAFFLSFMLMAVYLLVNINPYATNLLEGKHILFPAMGEGREEILAGQTPTNFIDESRITTLFKSTFSETANGIEPAVLKWPWSISWREFSIFPAWYDTRKGGFGATFPMLLICSLLTGFGALFKFRSREMVVAFFIVAAIGATTLVNPANWWARLVPQFWLIPIVLLAAAILYSNGITKKAAKIILVMAVFIQGFNLLAYVYYQNTTTQQIRANLSELRSIGKEINVDFRKSQAFRECLRENKIPFKPVEIDKAEGRHIPHVTAVYAIP